MADPHESNQPTPASLGTSGRVLAVSASDIPDPTPKTIVLLEAGDITIVPVSSSQEIAFVGLSAGYSIPYRVKKVTAATGAFASVDG